MIRYHDSTQSLTIAEALDSRYVIDNLKALAKAARIERPPTRKAELVKVLVEKIKSDRLLNLMTDFEKKALAETVHSETGLYNTDYILAKCGKSPYDTPEPDSYCREKSLLDLYIVDGYIPYDLKSHLVTIIPRPPEDKVAYLHTLPSTITITEKYLTGESSRTISLDVRETAGSALQNLVTVLRLADIGKIRVSTKTLVPSRASMLLIIGNLQNDDWYEVDEYGAIQGFSWPLLVQASGFAKVDNGKLVVSSKGRKVLNDGIRPHEALKTLWEAWIKKGIIDEFRQISEIKGQGSKKSGMTSVKDRRKTVAEALSDLSVMKWISIDEFGRHMQATNRTFDVSRNPWALYISDPQYGSLGYAGSHGWEILQKRYIQVLLMGYAATLGIIDIGYCNPDEALRNSGGIWGIDMLEYLSLYDGLQYFRINDLGAYILGIKSDVPDFEEKPQTVFEILSNFDIVITDISRISKFDRLYLSKIANQKTDMQWKLTRGSISKAIEDNESVESISEFLQKRSAKGLPETVTALLREAKSSTIDMNFLGRAVLLECNDKHMFQRLQVDAKLNSISLFANEKYIVPLLGNETLFFKRLNELGYAAPVAKEVI